MVLRPCVCACACASVSVCLCVCPSCFLFAGVVLLQRATMGNEQGIMADRMMAGQSALPRLQSVGAGLAVNDAQSPNAPQVPQVLQQPGGQACVRLLFFGCYRSSVSLFGG